MAAPRCMADPVGNGYHVGVDLGDWRVVFRGESVDAKRFIAYRERVGYTVNVRRGRREAVDSPLR